MTSKKWTTIYIDSDVLKDLNELNIVASWVPLKTNSDKMRYLLFEHKNNSSN